MREHPFNERLASAGTRHVFYGRHHHEVNIVALARMSLFAIQNDLLLQFAAIAKKKPMAMDPEISSNLRRLLHEYCKL